MSGRRSGHVTDATNHRHRIRNKRNNRHKKNPSLQPPLSPYISLILEVQSKQSLTFGDAMASSTTTTPPLSQSQRTLEARAAFTATLTSVGTSLDSDLRSRAADIHSNSVAIAKQEADVSKESSALKKESDRYQKVADASRVKLKEIGDIQNWAELLERDLLVLEETLRLGGEGEREIRKSGGEGVEAEGLNGWH